MKTKRFLALLLVLVLVASFVPPVTGTYSSGFAGRLVATKAGITKECMVYPLGRTINKGFIVGESTELSFKLNGSTPRKDDVLCIEVYDGSLSGELIDQRFYPVSKFNSKGTLDISWKPDSRRISGYDYVLVGIILTADYKVYGQRVFCTKLHRIDSKVRPTEMQCGYVKAQSENLTCTIAETDSGKVEAGETIAIVPIFWPVGAYTSMPLKATAEDPNVAKVWVEDGYVMAKGLVRGQTKVNIQCDYFQTYFIATFGEPVAFKLKAENTELCVGATDVITATMSKSGDPIYCSWTSTDPSIATVKNGVVTALMPGTVTIFGTAYGTAHGVKYTINYHQLPEGTPVSEITATHPKQAVGHCSICGKDDAVNVYEPAIFTDTVWNSWYAPHVDKVYDAGLMKGTGEHTFAPNANVTRAMAATVLYRIAGEPEVEGEIPFSDVPEGKYYTNAVIWAAQNEIVNGYPDGTFRPDVNITREQLAAILYRSASKNDHVLAEEADLSGFPDAPDVHAYAKEAMGWAVGAGLINGVGSGGKSYLQPANNATRAQFATIISRYLTALEENEERPDPSGNPEPVVTGADT